MSLAVVCICAATAILASPQSASADNYVTNGSFDNNVSGWTGTYNVLNGPSGEFPIMSSGTYFWAGETASTTITQTYNLTAADLNSLSTISINYVASADLFGYLTQLDSAYFSVEFFGGENAEGLFLTTSS